MQGTFYKQFILGVTSRKTPYTYVLYDAFAGRFSGRIRPPTNDKCLYLPIEDLQTGKLSCLIEQNAIVIGCTRKNKIQMSVYEFEVDYNDGIKILPKNITFFYEASVRHNPYYINIENRLFRFISGTAIVIGFEKRGIRIVLLKPGTVGHIHYFKNKIMDADPIINPCIFYESNTCVVVSKYRIYGEFNIPCGGFVNKVCFGTEFMYHEVGLRFHTRGIFKATDGINGRPGELYHLGFRQVTQFYQQFILKSLEIYSRE
jgi:hypothetical protein